MKYYAVINGRDGPFAVYGRWSPAFKAIHRLPGVRHRSFSTLAGVEEFVGARHMSHVQWFMEEEEEKEIPKEGDASETKLTVWTDGGCEGNGTDQARASIGVHIPGRPDGDISLRLPGPRQESNRAELFACLMGVLSMGLKDQATLYTDSSSTLRAVKEAKESWENFDLVVLIREAMRFRPGVTLCKIKAHSGVPGNERADQLATQALKKTKKFE